jgi:DNA-binding SARP family transcriptional activator
MSGVVDAFKGVISDALYDYPGGRAWAILIVAASQDAGHAKASLQQALQLANANGDASLKMLASLALSQLVSEPPNQLLANEHEPVREALKPFLERFARLNAENASLKRPAMRIEVATGRLCRDGEPLKLSFKTLELLIALAVESRPLAKEILLERLWPDQPRASAQNALKMLVHRTRRHAGDPQLVIVKNGMYELGSHVTTDVRLMRHVLAAPHERPDNATELLDALLEGRPSAFAAWDWFAPFEQQLLGITADLGLALGREALQNGNVDRALFYSQALVQLDPCDEAATELLIRAHLARGERHLAISKYRRLERSLKRELDAQPSFSVEELLKRSRGGG